MMSDSKIEKEVEQIHLEDQSEFKEDEDGITRKTGLFSNIDGDQTVQEIESMCMNCQDNGITRLLLTKIPHFREVIIMAFECEHCGFKNNEIQSASTIAEKGLRITCKINDKKDLNRQVVKSEKATITIPCVDLTISPSAGSLNTVEGVVLKTIEELLVDQPSRLAINYEQWQSTQKVIDHLQRIVDADTEMERFDFILDDPSGNSYIENLCAPNKDPQIIIKEYTRTQEQNEFLGIGDEAAGAHQEPEANDQIKVGDDGADDDLTHDVHRFFCDCSRCGFPGETKMHMLDIPHFKEVIVMSTVCDECGFKSNEIKTGGAISKQGKRISLLLTPESDDLSRDILKSETCGLEIPEIDLKLEAGTLGGRFTTIEGLIEQIYEELESKSPFTQGDSVDQTRLAAFNKFLGKLKKVLEFKEEFTLILDDPLANSYLQNIYAPDPDPNMKIELYERSFEDNEAWGLNDIKTEMKEDGTY